MNSFKLYIFLFELLYVIITTQEQYAPLVVTSKFEEAAITLESFSEHDYDKAPAYVTSHEANGEYLNFFCPLQTNNEGENVLIYRQKYENNIFLDEPTPVTCESPIRGVFISLKSSDKSNEYEMRLYVYKEVIKNKNEIITADSYNSHIIQMFNFTFNQELKMIISTSYEIDAPPFMSLTSNKKTIVPYDKNLEILESPLDERYEYFESKVRPLMLEKIDKSLLKKFCRRNKITTEECKEKTKNDEFVRFSKHQHIVTRRRIACDLGVQKVQLIPKDDFITDAKKTATYADVLTIPIWKAFLFKWNAVEIFLRKLAKITGKLKVETGVSGIMEEVEEHYIKGVDLNKQLHVPKYIWKIVHSILSNHSTAILIVLFNNPFDLSECNDFSHSQKDCIRNGWPIESEDSSTGKVCCFLVSEKIKKDLNINTKFELYQNDSFNLFDNYAKKPILSYVVSNPQKRIYDW